MIDAYTYSCVFSNIEWGEEIVVCNATVNSIPLI